MADPTLFDAAAARAAGEEAAEAAGAAAPPSWMLAALDAVHRTCLRLATFTTEDVWKALGEPDGVEPRALGAVMRTARGKGWCATTAEYRPTARVKAHGRPMRVWRSLIVATTTTPEAGRG